jgi:hypothetical protein
MAKKFEIQGIFHSAASARRECSRLLNLYKDELENFVSGNDFQWLKEAFEKHHYSPDKKIPYQITKIWVEDSSSGNNNQFSFEMENGKKDHIGFTSKCFVTDNKREQIAYEDNVVDAARQMIRTQQDEARDQFKKSNKMICVLCKLVISNNELHADHTPPDTFKEIFKTWLKRQTLEKKDIAYNDKGNSQVREFSDLTLGENWVTYHASRFKPQPTHAVCNLKQGRGVRSNESE